LIDGEFQVGQQVELLPNRIQTRIRGIQTHKKKLDSALPGSRTAINLVGVDVSEIQRGNVLVHPGIYRTTRRVDAKILMMKGASGKILHDDHLKCFIGTSQSIVRIRVIGEKEIKPGEWGWVQMELENEIVAEKTDHFILRRPSPAETIGGGIILDPRPARRYKRFSEAVLEKLRMLDSGSAGQILLSKLDEYCPITYQRLLDISGVEKNTAKVELDKLIGNEVFTLGQDIDRDGLLVTRDFWESLKIKVHKRLEDFYQRNPLRSGLPKNELSKYLKFDLKEFNQILQKLITEKFLIEVDGLVCLPEHSVDFSPAQQKIAAGLINEMKLSPYSPPSIKEMTEKNGADLIQAMVTKRMMIKISEDIAFLPEIYDQMLSMTKQFLERETRITLAQFRDMFQTSRKYALAFLEHLDDLQITVREDDFRRLKPS